MNRQRRFWEWFKRNEAKYFFLNQTNNDNEKERLLEEFLEHLHSYCDALYFEIGGCPDKKQDLIITAEGDTDFFDKVEALVKQAPQLEYWNIIAFKPIKEDYITEYNGIKLDPKAIWFTPLNNKNSKKLGLRIYIEHYDPSQDEDFLTVTYLVLDNILGEKSNALNIGYVEIACLPNIIERVNLIEISKLPRYIEWKKSKKSNI